jgi:hypothetical protein
MEIMGELKEKLGFADEIEKQARHFIKDIVDRMQGYDVHQHSPAEEHQTHGHDENGQVVKSQKHGPYHAHDHGHEHEKKIVEKLPQKKSLWF